ncbi:36800_t:CDS:2 [Racocetra persica]|uniref:36800_t:CDS:1 n=1 Tax=Racocetra persica TaxID=160502 RepID=A0ACA9KBC3_9GLOM|nr:36800_t:CDS:2 [Racocetra persica]
MYSIQFIIQPSCGTPTLINNLNVNSNKTVEPGNYVLLTITCYTCERAGHYSRNCPELPNIQNNSSANNSLLALINNSGTANNSENQTLYLSIPEEDEPLFLPAKRPIRPKPIMNTPILQKRQAETKAVNLINLEETGENKDPDIE